MTDNSGCADNPPWIRPVRIDICPKCMELKERIEELERGRCEDCGATLTLDGCVLCGAPVCCPQCCRIQRDRKSVV